MEHGFELKSMFMSSPWHHTSFLYWMEITSNFYIDFVVVLSSVAAQDKLTTFSPDNLLFQQILENIFAF